MNRKDMLKRLEAGEDPLELSIEKWRDIVDGKGCDYGSNNCALCEIVDHCYSCPVNVVTEQECYGTPYYEYVYAPTEEIKKEAALAELKFLLSLRKKTKNAK